MNVLSLFDGISCGMVALERSGIYVERYVAYEIDKYAISVSQKNYPMIVQCGDVTTADFAKHKGFDLLIGGSPCTFWSVAKNNREITPDGIGGQLFMHYVRALDESGCKWSARRERYACTFSILRKSHPCKLLIWLSRTPMAGSNGSRRMNRYICRTYPERTGTATMRAARGSFATIKTNCPLVCGR